jgi:thiol-disulfide isomerase/thioredoxin
MSRFLVACFLMTFLAANADAGETKPFGRGTWNEILKAHRGHDLAVHFWSLGCAPCLAEMPRWAEFRKTLPHMRLVLVSIDSIAMKERLERVLARHGLDAVESWAFADSFADRLLFEVDPEWRGELPMTRLVDRNGGAVSVIGGFDPHGIGETPRGKTDR